MAADVTPLRPPAARRPEAQRRPEAPRGPEAGRSLSAQLGPETTPNPTAPQHSSAPHNTTASRYPSAPHSPAAPRGPQSPRTPEPLWREVLGQRLRELRHERREKLTETAARAGISPQYLSEVERGRKEPSSEMIAALAGAFGLTLIDLTILVTRDLIQYAQYPQYVQLQTHPAQLQPQPSRHGLGTSGPVALLAVAA